MPISALMLLLANVPNWSQPPVGCIEELMPREPSFPCLDLTQVPNPSTDFPAVMTPEDQLLWKTERRRALAVCRAHEILRREDAAPGSQKPVAVEVSWMRVLALKSPDEKGDAIARATDAEGMPPQILLGALMQESVMADLGIAEDGGNYSCGIGQLNLLEWCGWAQSAPLESRRALGWPVERIAKYQAAHPGEGICEAPLLATSLLAPYYKLGLAALGSLPAYRLGPEHLQGIDFTQVAAAFPAAPEETQRLRHEIVSSFAATCSDYRYGIPAKAHELGRIYASTVPAALKAVQRYPESSPGYARECRTRPATRAYPLQTAWLLADAIYNAGPGVVPALAYYLRMDRAAFSSPAAWEKFTATDLISALYWEGKYNPRTDRLDYTDLSGASRSLAWYKSCVVQRHIARVIQYVTLDGAHLADSLEDEKGCQKSVFDASGALVTSAVPLARQKSSGRIEPVRR